MTTAEIIRLAALGERYDHPKDRAFLCQELDWLESIGRISYSELERAKVEVMGGIGDNLTAGQYIQEAISSVEYHPLPDNRARQAYWLGYANALERTKRRLLEMVSDPDDTSGIGKMLSQWTGEEVIEQIEAVFEGRNYV